MPLKSGKQNKIKDLVASIPSLTDGQLYWMEKVVRAFGSAHQFEIHEAELLDAETLLNFGDALRIHHCFSGEPFSKDKFEYVLETVLKMSGQTVRLASKGNQGHDIDINGSRVSLKTQADAGIKKDKIWISKFMELGRGNWGDNPKDLIGLRDSFFKHLQKYDRIFTLRALSRGPSWNYELVEIPKKILAAAKTGALEMKLESKQFPKPGYCRVRNEKGEEIFQLYFDGGGERKLQLKNLMKKYCIVHATWKFTISGD